MCTLPDSVQAAVVESAYSEQQHSAENWFDMPAGNQH